MRRIWDRLLDWLCDRLGVCIDLGGNLMGPSGDEPWWGQADGLDGSDESDELDELDGAR